MGIEISKGFKVVISKETNGRLDVGGVAKAESKMMARCLGE